MKILSKRIYKYICKKIYKTKFYKNIEIRFVKKYLNDNYLITLEDFQKKMNCNIAFDIITINDTTLYLTEKGTSNTLNILKREFSKDIYDFNNIKFKPGDVVVDIGANIGIVSIYLAKKYPFLKIYAFEPCRENYEHLLLNMKINNITSETIIAHNKAITKDGRLVCMNLNPNNLGGSSLDNIILIGGKKEEKNSNIQSTTLSCIIDEYNIKKIKLLKIDCEGSEYEILYNTPTELLNKIEILRGEFHENKTLTKEFDIDKLYAYIKNYINDINVTKSRACFIV